MIEKSLNYKAYMLRMWQEISDGQPVWRASLELPGPGERRAFPSLEALFTFLLSQTKQPKDEAEE